jgi:hypothetical protein
LLVKDTNSIACEYVNAEDQLQRIIASLQSLATKTGALARGPTLNLSTIIRIARILFGDDLQELEDA